MSSMVMKREDTPYSLLQRIVQNRGKYNFQGKCEPKPNYTNTSIFPALSDHMVAKIVFYPYFPFGKDSEVFAENF